MSSFRKASALYQEALSPLNQPWKSIPSALRVSFCLAAGAFLILLNHSPPLAVCKFREQHPAPQVSTQVPLSRHLIFGVLAGSFHALLEGRCPFQLFPHPFYTTDLALKKQPQTGRCVGREQGVSFPWPSPLHPRERMPQLFPHPTLLSSVACSAPGSEGISAISVPLISLGTLLRNTISSLPRCDMTCNLSQR